MKTLMIRDILPGRAVMGTLTGGRRFLQVIFQPMAADGYLVTEKISSRNFWDAFIGGEVENGAELNIQADPLFLSICDACGINENNIENVDWGTRNTFLKASGMKVHGELVTHYVAGYEIPNSLSKISKRHTYSTIVLEGEDENSVFKNSGHVIIYDPEQVEEIKKELQRIATINEEAREQRQLQRGVLPNNQRVGTGDIVRERSLEGKDDSLLENDNEAKLAEAK